MKQFVAKLRKALREWDPTVRRIAVVAVGGLLLVAGVALIFLPGPALVVLPVGVGILATEFPAIRQRVRRASEWITQRFRRIRAKTRKLARDVSPLI